MIEIPESAIISRQAAGVLTGRRIAEVIPATSPHKFTWYNGDRPDILKYWKDAVLRPSMGMGHSSIW